MKKHNKRFTVSQLSYAQEARTVKIPCRIFDKKTGIETERIFPTHKSAKRFCRVMNRLNNERETRR